MLKIKALIHTSIAVLHISMNHQLNLHKHLVFLVGLSKIVTKNKNILK